MELRSGRNLVLVITDLVNDFHIYRFIRWTKRSRICRSHIERYGPLSIIHGLNTVTLLSITRTKEGWSSVYRSRTEQD